MPLTWKALTGIYPNPHCGHKGVGFHPLKNQMEPTPKFYFVHAFFWYASGPLSNLSLKIMVQINFSAYYKALRLYSQDFYISHPLVWGSLLLKCCILFPFWPFKVFIINWKYPSEYSLHESFVNLSIKFVWNNLENFTV